MRRRTTLGCVTFRAARFKKVTLHLQWLSLVAMATVKIYKLYAPGHSDNVYIGSTKQTLIKRLRGHVDAAVRGLTCTSAPFFLLYGRDAVKMITLEECPIEQRSIREAYWIKQHPTAVNKQMPQPPEISKRIYNTIYHATHREEQKALDKARYAKKKAIAALQHTTHASALLPGSLSEAL
jgi:hypothetical protein